MITDIIRENGMYTAFERLVAGRSTAASESFDNEDASTMELKILLADFLDCALVVDGYLVRYWQ